MAIDYSSLKTGDVISQQRYLLDTDKVGRYMAAVADGSGPLLDPSDGQEVVPPMAIAALSLRGVVNDLKIPGGTLHAGQELEFVQPVKVGTSLECRATLVQNSVRGGWRIMVVRLSVEAPTSRGEVLTGKSTITLPA